MATVELDNPFYHNYVFHRSDLQRCLIRPWQYPLLWLLPTYVQMDEGMVFYYKRFNGKVYLMRYEELPHADAA